jgi:hypothetical protein
MFLLFPGRTGEAFLPFVAKVQQVNAQNKQQRTSLTPHLSAPSGSQAD